MDTQRATIEVLCLTLVAVATGAGRRAVLWQTDTVQAKSFTEAMDLLPK